MKAAIAAIVFVAATLAAGPPADAMGNCRLVGETIVCDDEIPSEQPTPFPNQPDNPPPRNDDSPYYVTTRPAIGPCPRGEQHIRFDTRLRATGEIISSYSQCVPDGEPTPPPPPPPPPPPTTAQFAIEIEPLLDVETGLSPPPGGIGGVSQLATWFWCDSDAPVNVDLTLGGWRTTASASVTSLTWSIDGPDGHIEVGANDCGEEPDPDSGGSAAATTWTPNEAGDYAITLAATWGGSWTRSFGGVSETLPLGSVTVGQDPVAYTVIEIQTVGVDNP